MKDTPIPARMSHLPRDTRGYPIPAIVFRDSDGRPYFTINNDSHVKKCADKRWCGICGRVMHRNDVWFVGGPGSAFHEYGAYLDGPVHKDCGTYALQVCPYIAAPKYSRRVDDRQLTDKARSEVGILHDPTVIPERPEVFVFGRTKGYSVMPGPQGQVRFRPIRPFEEVEYWRLGERLPQEEGRKYAAAALEKL